MKVDRKPEQWPRRIKPPSPTYVLRTIPGRRFCPSCKQERPWAGKVKRAGWECGECAK